MQISLYKSSEQIEVEFSVWIYLVYMMWQSIQIFRGIVYKKIIIINVTKLTMAKHLQLLAAFKYLYNIKGSPICKPQK